MGRKPNLYNILNLFCFAIVLMVIVVAVRPSPSCAQNTGLNAGCAPDTYTAMVNQAALEVRREDLMNKRYIVKASSVLQYSCFIKEVINMGENIGPIFSNNEDFWLGKEVRLFEGTVLTINPFNGILNADSLTTALYTVVVPALAAYIGQQFDHEVLSATTGHSEPDPLCFNMANVWNAAKCKNFDGTTVFYRFNELISFDPREFPPELKCEL